MPLPSPKAQGQSTEEIIKLLQQVKHDSEATVQPANELTCFCCFSERPPFCRW